MAIILRVSLNSFCTSVFSRLLKPKIYAQKGVRFASLKDPLPKQNPVQYSSNKASKMSIAEIFGLVPIGRKTSEISKSALALATILISLLVYFCIIRVEENEYDEIFKTGIGHSSKPTELLDLKLKLQYCKQNNLPTDALKARIAELEKNIPKPSPFRV